MTNLIRKALCLAASTLLLSFTARAERATDYVDPKIGAEGLGRVYIGPANPFGMVRPGPDCTPSPNSGWLPMPERVDGFAQTHVSGTGGGPKYGNILIQPYLGDLSSNSRPQLRAWEDISLGRYATAYEGSGIQTEVTTAPRASFYRITFPATYYGGKAAAADQDGRKGSDDAPSLLVDAGFFLGETRFPTPARLSNWLALRCRYFPTERWQAIAASGADGTTDGHIPYISICSPTVRLSIPPSGKVAT